MKKIIKNKKFGKFDKSCSGGILLEVLLMLAIMMVIFPFMQKDIKKRTDNIRNQKVAKDLLRLKGAVEVYLKKRPDIKEGLQDIDFSELVDSGLPKSFKKVNILDQTYKVRVKVSKDADLNFVYDAIIIATGNDKIPPLRLHDIVKVSKGFVGYVDGDLVYAPSWQLAIQPWSVNNDINDTSLVVKTGLSKKDYKYISRVPNYGTATMQTDLYLNLNNIYDVKHLFVINNMDIGSIILKGLSSISNITISKNLKLDRDANIYVIAAKFTEAIKDEFMEYVDRFAKNIYLDLGLYLFGLKVLSDNKMNELRSIITEKFSVSDNSYQPTIMTVDGKILFEGSGDDPLNPNPGKLKLQELYVDTLTLGARAEFTSMKSLTKGYYWNSDKGMFLKDIIVRNVNKKIIQDLGMLKIGGIDITMKTPLSVIFRGLHYAYCDLYKIIHNKYPNIGGSKDLVPGWYCNLYKRCEYAECQDPGWYYE